MFYFYNTKTNRKEIFKPKDENCVTIYSCGPTVYNFAHIGNIRSFLFVDILRRSLLFAGYSLNQTMNITDIDDKIIRESIAQGISVEEFTKPWTKVFFEDLASLNIQRVEHYPKATESISDMVGLVEKLKLQGLVYEKEGSLYYSIQKFPGYGKLSRIDLSGMKSGARYDTDEYEKDDVRDFVLWKKSKSPDEKSWETELGSGRPGWHLECSAMIRKIYNSGIDIHTGGIDLIFPHHENEVALSEGAFPGEEFVGTWLHCEHLLVDGEKMSKSKGNFFTLRDLLSKGYEPRQIRYHLLSAHYKSKLNFSLPKLDESKQALERIQTTLFRVLEALGFSWVKIGEADFQLLKSSIHNARIKESISEFETGISDDLNMPKALASIFDFIREINFNFDQAKWEVTDYSELVYYFQLINSILGFLDFERPSKNVNLDEINQIELHIRERSLAKKNKDFVKSDQIRRQLLAEEIILIDHKDGTTTWKKNQ